MSLPTRLPGIALSLALLAILALPAFALADQADADGLGVQHATEPNVIPGPDAGLIAAVTTLLLFLGLVAILGRYAWGPIVAGLKAREDKIRADIQAAERARADADRARLELQQQLEKAEEVGRDIRVRATADGQQIATRIRMQAQEEAEEIKERALREIEQSRREAIEQIRAEAAILATAIAEKILRREVSVDDQKRLVEESLNELQAVGA